MKNIIITLASVATLAVTLGVYQSDRYKTLEIITLNDKKSALYQVQFDH